MTDRDLITAPSVRIPAGPEAAPFDKLMSSSGPAFMGLFHPGNAGRDAATLRAAIGDAERFLAGAAAIAGQLSDAVQPESDEAIGRQLNAFVEAWPNATRGDLTGYGLQLALDVADRNPCRYALHTALRHLRQSSRFLPSISEVLSALDDATGRIRNTAFHLQELPALLARARAELATAETRERRPLPDASEDVR